MRPWVPWVPGTCRLPPAPQGQGATTGQSCAWPPGWAGLDGPGRCEVVLATSTGSAPSSLAPLAPGSATPAAARASFPCWPHTGHLLPRPDPAPPLHVGAPPLCPHTPALPLPACGPEAPFPVHLSLRPASLPASHTPSSSSLLPSGALTPRCSVRGPLARAGLASSPVLHSTDCSQTPTGARPQLGAGDTARTSQRNPGAWGCAGVERPPWAQVMIPGSWDRVPHQAPRRKPASSSACVSASLSLCGSHE